MRQLSTTDTKKKLLVGQQLIEFLGDPESVAECDDMGACVDSLVPWMQSSNFKVLTQPAIQSIESIASHDQQANNALPRPEK